MMYQVQDCQQFPLRSIKNCSYWAPSAPRQNWIRLFFFFSSLEPIKFYYGKDLNNYVMLRSKGLWYFVGLFLMVSDRFRNPAFLYSTLGWLDVNIMFLCVSFMSNYSEENKHLQSKNP